MPSFGKSIKTFLADGSPTGLRHVEIANWSGQALACPRNRFSELSEWEEAKRPGVYFLFETASSDGNNLTYIGESEDVFDRLATHDRKKDFWNEVVIFTSKDENLTKGHIKYLEARLYDISKTVDRYELANGNHPTRSILPRSDTAAMEEFIHNVRLVLGTLGHKILEPIANSPETKPIKPLTLSDFPLQFKLRKLTAYGRVADDGFLVLANSQFVLKASDSLQASLTEQRQQLIADGALQLSNGHYVLTKNKLFSASSSAAAIIAGNPRSGPQSWKSETGESLKELEERLLLKSDDRPTE